MVFISLSRGHYSKMAETDVGGATANRGWLANEDSSSEYDFGCTMWSPSRSTWPRDTPLPNVGSWHSPVSDAQPASVRTDGKWRRFSAREAHAEASRKGASSSGRGVNRKSPGAGIQTWQTDRKRSASERDQLDKR